MESSFGEFLWRVPLESFCLLTRHIFVSLVIRVDTRQRLRAYLCAIFSPFCQKCKVILTGRENDNTVLNTGESHRLEPSFFSFQACLKRHSGLGNGS